MRTVPLMLGFYIGKHGTDFGRLTAASVLLFFPVFIFYLVFNRSMLGVSLTGALR
jgi:ABC-type glycerol-3-phosphate transport system permease component